MILVINAGSSNVKFGVYDEQTLQSKYRDQVSSMQDLYVWLHKSKYAITAIGHRVVHGGNKFFKPVRINTEILNELKQFIPLAPLHQPHNIAGIEYIMKKDPNMPQIACFDTAFHTTQSALAKQIAIPQELSAEGIIRYGFHGLSYEYIASVLESKIGHKAHGKIIVAHLGNGTSMCAMHNLQSAATTMGFSALDGLMMGTRCGSIDPGVLLYLLQQKNYTPPQITDLLYNQSGLLGVSGLSSDMRDLLKSDSATARNAVDLFCYRAASEFCKLLTSIQGCDGLIFTAGIGENAPAVRAKICRYLNWLGIKLDDIANEDSSGIISSPESSFIVAVIPTDEEVMIAQHVKFLIGKKYV